MVSVSPTAHIHLQDGDSLSTVLMKGEKKSNMYPTSHNFLGHLIRAKPHCGVRNMSIKTFLHPNQREGQKGDVKITFE